MPQVNYLPRMQITSNEARCLGVDVMRRVEDSVKKGKKGIFYSALALNSFRSDPGNRREILGLECALSSFKGEIAHIVCKMPSALARADHPRPNIFRKDKYSIGSVALMVELFSRAEIKISIQLDIINISKLMMPSQGEMRHKVICSNMQVMPKHFTWKERRGFYNGLRFPNSLLAKWKEIWKKSQIVARKATQKRRKGKNIE